MAIKKTVKKQGKYIVDVSFNGGRSWEKIGSYPDMDRVYEELDDQMYFAKMDSENFGSAQYRIRSRKSIGKGTTKKKTVKKRK